MSSFDKDINQIEKMMKKYKFKEPIPVEVRAHIIVSRKRLFKRILKTLGILTIGYSIFMSIYFFLKQVGITKLILSVIVASSVTTGTYVTIQYIKSKNMLKPLELRVTPDKIHITDTDRIKDIKIITVMENHEKKDITLLAKVFVEPKELASIQFNRENNSVDLLFKQKGKGKLRVEWQGLASVIDLSYLPKSLLLNPLQQLHKQYNHTEKILLEDGSVFKGVLIDKGNGNIVFITPETTLKLKRSDIVKIEYLTPDMLK